MSDARVFLCHRCGDRLGTTVKSPELVVERHSTDKCFQVLLEKIQGLTGKLSRLESRLAVFR